MTHYITLGVAEDATADDIKRTYRRLASQHHPDRGGDTARFQEIQAAYDVLGDPQRRAQYDQQRRTTTGGFRFNFNGQDITGHPGVEEIFRNFGFQYGSDPFGPFRQPSQPRRNRDLQVEITVPLVSTLEDQTKVLSVQTTNGHRETVEVRIPRGILGHSTMKYPELGDNFFGNLPRGDLYVNVHVEPDPQFEISGLHLITKLDVDCVTAMGGGDVTVTGLDGRIFSVTVPAGAQNGTGYRIAEQGLWQMNTLTRGHLIAKINITVPQNLNEDQLALVNQLRQTL